MPSGGKDVGPYVKVEKKRNKRESVEQPEPGHKVGRCTAAEIDALDTVAHPK